MAGAMKGFGLQTSVMAKASSASRTETRTKALLTRDVSMAKASTLGRMGTSTMGSGTRARKMGTAYGRTQTTIVIWANG